MNDQNDEFNYEDSSTVDYKSRTVPMSRGFYWLERSLTDVVAPHFSKWFSAGIVYAAVALMAQIIHPILSMAVNILLPVFIAGGLIGANQSINSQSPTPIQFFSAFKHYRLPSLLIYAGIHLVMLLMVGMVLASIIGIETLQSLDVERLQNPNDQEYALYILGILKGVIPWVILLSVIYLFLTWFSPCLIVHADKNPFVAISESFFASIKNIGAFLIFIILMIVISLILLFGLGLILVATGLAANIYISLTLSLFSTALIMPIIIGVIYISYCEVFLGEVKESQRSL